MRIDGSVDRVPVLVAIGVTESGHRMVLGSQARDEESEPSRREFFKDLIRGGLNAAVNLGVMNGLPGLEEVFQEEFPKAKVQRCPIDVARNVLAKAPRNLNKVIADRVRSIFKASSRSEAVSFSLSSRPGGKRNYVLLLSACKTPWKLV